MGNNRKYYNTHNHMKRRCYIPTEPQYSDYGGRGIKVCERWLEPNGKGLRNFVADMGERSDGMTLDRIDNDGDYTPENCRWADRTTQSNNRRINRLITFQGKTLSLSQWAKELDLKRSTLAQRFYVYKWPVERCLSGGY